MGGGGRLNPEGLKSDVFNCLQGDGPITGGLIRGGGGLKSEGLLIGLFFCLQVDEPIIPMWGL